MNANKYRVVRKGPHAESLFSSLCLAAGAYINPTLDDQNGSDFFLEVRPHDNELPADLQPKMKQIQVQVKSQVGRRPTVKIRLSNALRSVNSDLSWFIVLYHYKTDDAPPTLYAIHIWGKIIVDVLRMSRIASSKGKALNRTYHSITLSSANIVSEDEFIDWAGHQIEGVGANYAAEKAQVRSSAGYEGVSRIGSFKIEKGTNVATIVAHEIGLLPDLPVEQITIFDERFGIRSSQPIFEMSGGRISFQPQDRKTVRLTFSRPDGQTLDMTADLRHPLMVSAEFKEWRARIFNEVVEMGISASGTEIDFSIQYNAQSTFSIEKQRQCMWLFYSLAEFDLKIRINATDGNVLRGKLSKGAVEKEEWHERVLSFLDGIRLLDAPSRFWDYSTSLNRLISFERKFWPLGLILSPGNLSLRMANVGKLENLKELIGYLILDFDQLGYLVSIVRFRVSRVEPTEDATTVFLQFEKCAWSELVDGTADDTERFAASEFQSYCEDVAHRVAWFGNGDFLGGLRLAVRTGLVDVSTNRDDDE